MAYQPVSAQTQKRLPSYYNFLKSLGGEKEFISATAIAKALCLNDVQVRKDLAAVSGSGRPKVGYPVSALLADMERSVGNADIESAVLIGVGDLGRAVLSYEGLAKQGMDIAAAFDDDPETSGRCICGRQVLDCSKLPSICRTMHIRTGIITVPGDKAQAICDRLTENGVNRILNLTSAVLSVQEDVRVVHMDIRAAITELLAGRLRNEKSEGICAQSNKRDPYHKERNEPNHVSNRFQKTFESDGNHDGD